MEKAAAENYMPRTFVIFVAHPISFGLQAKEDELARTHHAKREVNIGFGQEA